MSFQPFKVSNQISSLVRTYPKAEEIIWVAKNGGKSDAEAIARLWMSEGIPYAFKDCPGLYESVRQWIAIRLEVDPKEVNISGSARIGESLAPSKLGIKFGSHSDLDLFIVSEKAFLVLKDEFFDWSDEYEQGNIKPQNQREAGYWSENVRRVPKNIECGFIDVKYIPKYPQFKQSVKWSECEDLLVKKLSVTNSVPSVKGASFRCYRNWESFTKQLSLNLRS